MKIRRLSIENLEHRRVLAAAGGVEGPAWESVIVSLNDNVGNPKAVGQGIVNAHGGQIGHVYEHSIKGFSAQLPAAAVAALAKNPNVKLIEPDLAMQAFEQIIPNGIKRINAEPSAVGSNNSVDVNIAIIDSGIDMGHPDLNVVGGRHFYTINSGPPRNRGSVQDNNYDDDYGHGTHVAGTAAALDNGYGVVGVAPGARLWAVKVLDSNGSGYVSDIIAGIDWVTSTRADGDATNDIEVANMSLGGVGASTIYHTAIKNSVNAGVVYVVSAGNSYRDILGTDFQFGTSDDTIPAAYPEVATISAIADTDGIPGSLGGYTNYADYFGPYKDDTFADFSNFSNSQAGGASFYNSNNKVTSPGLGIDLMLPGVDIYSTYNNGGYATMSGTSMAAPHAAGLAALYIAEHGRATSAAEVYEIRQALINGGKGWNSPEGLYVPDPTNNPDSPDNHIENLGWAGPSAPPVPTHDIAITSVTATPLNALLGTTIQISINVVNQGTFDEVFDVSVTAAGQPIYQSSESLVAGLTTTIELAWVPNSVGTFTIVASAQPVSGESDLDDNTETTSVSIIDVPPMPTESIIDDGDSGYVKNGSWSAKLGASAYNGDYDSASGGNGAATATWNFAGLPAGDYDVYATWVSHPKKQASNAPFSVLGTTVLVNQQKSPNGAEIAGWERLTTVGFDGNGELSVQLANNANGMVVADAIRVVNRQIGANIGQSLAAAWFPTIGSSASTALLPAADSSITINPAASIDMYFSTFGDAVEIALPNELSARRSSKQATLDMRFEPLPAELLSDESLTTAKVAATLLRDHLLE